MCLLEVAYVGVLICGLNDFPDEEVERLELTVKRISEKYSFLHYISRVKCKAKRKELEEILQGFDRVIILSSDPYSDSIRDLVRSLASLEIESHMVKVLDATLAFNGELKETFLERELVYWGRYLSTLNKNKMILTMSRFKEKLRRRDLLRLVSRGFLERRFLPTIDKSSCIADYGCTKCTDYCPVDALRLWDKKKKDIEVFETKCVSCGICEAVCPTNAIEVHNLNNNLIQESFSEMISNTDSGVIVIASCNVKLYKMLLEEAKDIISGKKVFNLPLECVGRMDPILNLSLLKLGAKGIILLDCEGKCPYKINRPLIKENAEGTRRLLESFKKEAEKIQIVSMEKSDWREQLKKSIEKIEETEDFDYETQPILFEKGDLKFKYFTAIYSKYLDTIPEGSHLGEIYGPINILVDTQKCTMCNACVVNCPSQALIMKNEGDKARLLFIPANCVACKNCIEVCPENAMSYKDAVDIKKIVTIEEVQLKEDELAKCKNCGKPIGPISQLKKVERLLKIRWQGSDKVLEHLYYCEECKKLKVLGLI